MGFQGKVVILTGAGSGIGEQLALRLFDEGALVVLAGRRAEKLAAVAARSPDPAAALAVATDVSEHAGLERLVRATLDKHGRIDVLVNNAGVNYGGALLDMTPEEIEYALRVNLLAPIWLTHLALPHLLRSRDSLIVNVMSFAGLVPLPFQSIYVAAKFGLGGFTRAMQRELRGSSVHVLAAWPGGMDTEMMSPKIKEKLKDLGTTGPGMMPAPEAARRLLSAMHKRKKNLILAEPKDRLTLLVSNWFPFLIDRACDKLGPQLREIMSLGSEMQRERKPLPPIGTPSTKSHGEG
jgi:hypothetical protein